MKYDIFAEGRLRILEVDASSDAARDTFYPADFAVDLTEITGDESYYGYKMVNTLKRL